MAVGREHWEAVEGVVVCDALKGSAIHFNHIKIEVAPAWVVHVRGEDYAACIWKEVGRKARSAKMRYLSLIASVRVHYPDFKNIRFNHILRELLPVARNLFRRLRMIGAIDNLMPVV